VTRPLAAVIVECERDVAWRADTDHAGAEKHGEEPRMSTITAYDGTEIYYKDWGEGPAVTFSHGWPLSADAWDGQMLFLAQQGFRVIAHDRRGHGRSSQASTCNDMDGYADDLAAVIEALNLQDVALVGHSTGGEVAWVRPNVDTPWRLVVKRHLRAGSARRWVRHRQCGF
jgi:alpha/beta hydrolase fold